MVGRGDPGAVRSTLIPGESPFPEPPRNSSQIPDDAFLAAVETARTMRGHTTATRWDVAAVLAGRPEDVGATADEYPAFPQSVILAKARRLYRPGKLTCCICGCRGDFAPVAAK